jgi:two-component sensor histidine kinase
LLLDTWPVSVNVVMPAGLVVNELFTNALKHAFAGRNGGTISLHSLVNDAGCRVIIADNGLGLAADTIWPKPGKLSAMIFQKLRQNAKAKLEASLHPAKEGQLRYSSRTRTPINGARPNARQGDAGWPVPF